MTAKQIAGYLKARRDQRGSTFGGITFNDGYNVPTFGITKAEYDAISRAMNAEYGAFGEPTNLTPAVVKKALSNHPISEQRGTRHHATKKSPAQLQREIDEVLAQSSGGSSNKTVNQFWDFVEEELVKSVANEPDKYALKPDEPPEVFARRIRDVFQRDAEEKGLSHTNLGTPTWKRLAKRLGIAKFSQKALKDAYAAYGGKV